MVSDSEALVGVIRYKSLKILLLAEKLGADGCPLQEAFNT
jgi:hypothetical protein